MPAGPDDLDRWTKAHELVAEPLDRDGTFLDASCSNGHLMESVRSWAARRGVHVEPYGLEPDPEVAALARTRLPQWADRIWTGEPATWTPPRRFDTVRVAPDAAREDLLRRVLDELLEPGGRLLIGPYETAGHDPAERVRGWGLTVGRLLESRDPDTGTVSRLLVVPVPEPVATVTDLDEHRRRRSG